MEIIGLLLPMALVIAVVFVVFFIWAAKNGQYDDLETPASRMLLDENKIKKTINKGSVNE